MSLRLASQRAAYTFWARRARTPPRPVNNEKAPQLVRTAAVAAAEAEEMAEETLRFVTATGIEPLVFVNPTPGGGNTYSGYLIDLLGPLLLAANITAPYELYVLKGASGGTLQANGSWSGVMGELVSRRANMSVFPLTLTATREPFIDSTLPFIDAGYAMLIQVWGVLVRCVCLCVVQFCEWLTRALNSN